MRYEKIPEATMRDLTLWISEARPLGSFCAAVVSNDLRESFKRADEENRAALFDIVMWLYSFAPIGSWGSSTVLETWPLRVKIMREHERQRKQAQEKKEE